MSEIEHIAFSGRGKREENQDRYLAQYIDACCHLFIVCDGMGGHRHGARAAELALQATRIHLLSNVLAEKNRELFQRLLRNIEQTFSAFIREHPEYTGMGTTLALLLLHEGKAHIMWAGDSRILHLRHGRMLYQTEEHNMAAVLLRNGRVEKDSLEYRYKKNVLTNGILGPRKPADFSYHVIERPAPGDHFIVASDGFTEAIENGDIRDALSESDLESSASQMKNLCERRSDDNYTFILVKV